jgi:hypothetical protein
MRAALSTLQQRARFLSRSDSAPAPRWLQFKAAMELETQCVAHGESLEHRITEGSVKHVSGAGRIHAIHHKSWGINKLPGFPRESSVRP